MAFDLQKFQHDGYLVIEDFLSRDQCDALMKECSDLIDGMNPSEHRTVFSTTKQTYRDDYFLNSSDKIGYFFEDGALNKDGVLVCDKHKSLNKIGHALHAYCPQFRAVTFSDQVKNIMKSLAFTKPAIPQSMYIFKQPGIGGEVTPHQDATFLWSEPQKLVGLWIALENATEQNGCLWFIPGGLVNNYRMVRNPDAGENSPRCIFRGDPPTYAENEFIAVPVKRGSLVLIDGLVVHKSEKNVSNKSRHIYTFHIFEKENAVWSPENWLQPSGKLPFPELYTYQY